MLYTGLAEELSFIGDVVSASSLVISLSPKKYFVFITSAPSGFSGVLEETLK